MVFILLLFALYGINGCLADSDGVSGTTMVTPVVSSPTGTPEIPAKATIAPIHTKEPVVKPPVESQKTPGATATPTPVESRPPVPSVTETPVTVPTTYVVDTGNNETAETYYQWGKAYEDIGNYDAALAEYEKAIARDPYYTDAWYHRAVCYEKKGMYDEAYDSYRFLLTIDPGFFSSGKNESVIRNPLNISPNGMPPGQDPNIPFMISPLIWILAGTGVGGLVISAVAIYHIRRRPTRESTPILIRQSSGPISDRELSVIGDKAMEFYDGDPYICNEVIRLAIEIAREGREGKPVGTAFILGDSDAVLARSRQLILNPLEGHSSTKRIITNSDMRENIKELALLDGAFVIREDGTVEAAGRYISIDTSKVNLKKGFGTRHVSVAAITQETKAIGIVVSESGGLVRIIARGRIILETS
ncbi:MAG: diadenylate cyclase [Methanospirillum sp.]|nr:diadenylate cyclase [Methanospirillum sp.]